MGEEQVQILATNDFHGRLLDDDRGPTAGAAVLSGAVKELRGDNPNTVFAAAGDLIGASTFESFIQRDKPTIDSLNEAGLEVSAVGNHEFDKGYDDLVNRVIAPYDPTTNPEGGAMWKYLGANVEVRDGSAATPLDKVWMKEMNGVQVGFIGAVTEQLPTLVSPDGIADIEVTDIVEASNTAADMLVADGADIVVLLVHEGAPGTDCDAMDDDPTSDFGSIVTGVNDNIDGIVSGHTHLKYNCSFPVAGWADRAVTQRPVVSAGQYGMALNQLLFTVDTATGEVTGLEQNVLDLKADPVDPELPERPGRRGHRRRRRREGGRAGRRAAGTDRRRVQPGEAGRRQDREPRRRVHPGQPRRRGPAVGHGVADHGGGRDRLHEPRRAARGHDVRDRGLPLHADLPAGGRCAAVRQHPGQHGPHGRPDRVRPRGAVAGGRARPVRSCGWGSPRASPTATPRRPAGSPAGTKGEVTGMWLDGEALDDDATYSVTVNSFLAAGGDGFATLTEGASKQDTGQTDLEAMVDYMAEFADNAPLPVDYSQRSVGSGLPGRRPRDLRARRHRGRRPDVAVDDRSGPTSTTTRSRSAWTATSWAPSRSRPPIQTALPGFDEAGTASVSVVLPDDAAAGASELVVTGAETGTEVRVPLQVEAGTTPTPTKADPVIRIKVKPGKIRAGRTDPRVVAIVRGDGEKATGRVRVKISGKKAQVVRLHNGRARLTFDHLNKAGRKKARVNYRGSDTIAAGHEKVTFRVVRR